MHQEWIATDLDGTLFSREGSVDAVAATWKRSESGELVPSSWMPEPRHALFTLLARTFSIVPVTARDLDSFSRVNISSLPLRDGAIVSNGAILLKPGTMLPDPDWDAEIEPLLAEWEEPLARVAETLEAANGASVRARLVASNTKYPAYLVAKATDGFWSEAEGLGLREALAPFKCRIAEVGRELQVLPPPVGKRVALGAFARLYRGGRHPLLALGDMPEDLGFLSEAAFMGTPRGSKLATTWCDGI